MQSYWHPELHRVLCEIDQKFDALNEKLERIIMSQSDIDAAVATDTALLNDLTVQTAAIGTAQAAFTQEIANLEAQGVDTSALKAINGQLAAAQAPLDTAVSALTAASAPAAPAPAPSEPSAS